MPINRVLITILLLLVGCQAIRLPAESEETAPPTATITADLPPTPAAADDPLANTQWQFVSFGSGEAVAPESGETAILLVFDGAGGVSGSSGCNSFGGQYQVQGTTLVFGEIISTLRACTDEALMQAEQQFLQALSGDIQFDSPLTNCSLPPIPARCLPLPRLDHSLPRKLRPQRPSRVSSKI